MISKWLCEAKLNASRGDWVRRSSHLCCCASHLSETQSSIAMERARILRRGVDGEGTVCLFLSQFDSHTIYFLRLSAAADGLAVLFQ